MNTCGKPMRGLYGAETVCARPEGHVGAHDPIWNYRDWTQEGRMNTASSQRDEPPASRTREDLAGDMARIREALDYYAEGFLSGPRTAARYHIARGSLARVDAELEHRERALQQADEILALYQDREGDGMNGAERELARLRDGLRLVVDAIPDPMHPVWPDYMVDRMVAAQIVGRDLLGEGDGEDVEAARALLSASQAQPTADHGSAASGGQDTKETACGCAACEGDPEAHGLHVCGKGPYE